MSALAADSGEYVPCPRCKGDCQVFAYTELPAMGMPSQGEYFQCPLCRGTGEAERNEAAEWAGEGDGE